jgi:hypothetical protein
VRLTPGRSPATLAVIRSEAELRSLEAASFNPRLLRRIATGARATSLTATDFTIADGLLGQAGDAAFVEDSEENRPTDIDSHWNRANRGSLKFSFEFKSENF